MDRGNGFALFAKMLVEKGTSSDHFTLQDVAARWYDFMNAALEANCRIEGRLKPDKDELRQGLQTVLKMSYPSKPTKIDGVLQRNAFKGWRLLEVARSIEQ